MPQLILAGSSGYGTTQSALPIIALTSGASITGVVVLHIGEAIDRFVSVFSQFGVVVRRISPVEQTLWEGGSDGRAI